MKTLRGAVLLVSIAGIACAGAPAQTVTPSMVTATVTGVVITREGQGIPGATVVLIENATGRRSTPIVTTAQGDYLLRNVRVGSYAVEASLSGFIPATQSIQVASGQVAGPTMVLVLGSGPRAVPIPLAR